jgi:hypothetical protein
MGKLGALLGASVAAWGMALSPAHAEPLGSSQILACQPNRADVAAVAVNDLRFGLESTYAWASANIRLTMRNGATRDYAITGRAEPTDKEARPNKASAGFTYPGFTCMAQYRSIISVRNCGGASKHRFCEIGITIFGMPMVYAVSMTAERTVLPIRASAP